MNIRKLLYPVHPGIPMMFLIVVIACNSPGDKPSVIVSTPEEMESKSSRLIRQAIEDALSSTRHPDEPAPAPALKQPVLANYLYGKKDFSLIWSSKETWSPPADSLYHLIKTARLFGLFPEDYHLLELTRIRQRFADDSLGRSDRKDARLWSRADILLTDAFIQMVRDIKLGRLPNDSVSLNKDSVLEDKFYLDQLDALKQTNSLSTLLASLEPRQRGYQLLKMGIPAFLDSADFREFTRVPSSRDSANFKNALQRRLFEGGYIAFDSVMADSAQLAGGVKKFQAEKGIAVDGRAGEATIRMLNLSDKEKFIRIAISMDKFKKLPPTMPSRYIWVNTASNLMDVIQDGEVIFSSKVISGKPKTRTPLLSSSISTLITYPQWVPPPSIIAKEILPAVKKNPGYLERKGFSLVDNKGEDVDPYTVDWSKYNKTMPYRVVQGSGDANALGVMKFFFDNKYSVYLHDTNQRYLFANPMRSLSHGCVRVQEWERLLQYILENDSLGSRGHYSKIDSVRAWLKNKEKHNLALKNRMPVFIRYFTCEGRDGGLRFYDDVYGDDKMLREKYFAGK